MNNKLASIAIKTFRGEWTADNGRNPALYLKASDFQRGKQLMPYEQEYISQRQKQYETYANTIPKNEVAADIESISNQLVWRRKSCILKRKQLDDLLEEQTRLQKELEAEEDTLEQMHQKHVDMRCRYQCLKKSLTLTCLSHLTGEVRFQRLDVVLSCLLSFFRSIFPVGR